MTEPLLRLTQVEKSYPHPTGPVAVLKGVDASFGAAETTAILGPSGSGKSTLLALLAGLDRPTAGRIQMMGQEITGLTERALTALRSRHLGIVFQQFHLMAHLTAAENVTLPLDLRGVDTARSDAREALAAVGLHHREDHYPSQMSGGECQRVAIARALVVRPQLLLADEPSGNLDTRTGEQVMDLLFGLVQDRGTTLILVTHNELLAQRCQRRLQLRDGRLIDA